MYSNTWVNIFQIGVDEPQIINLLILSIKSKVKRWIVNSILKLEIKLAVYFNFSLSNKKKDYFKIGIKKERKKN